MFVYLFFQYLEAFAVMTDGFMYRTWQTGTFSILYIFYTFLLFLPSSYNYNLLSVYGLGREVIDVFPLNQIRKCSK